MILSKSGEYFIPILHKKSFTKIVTAPHTQFKREYQSIENLIRHKLCSTIFLILLVIYEIKNKNSFINWIEFNTFFVLNSSTLRFLSTK